MIQGEKQIIGFKIQVIVEPDDDGFHAYCPALKGLHTCGNTEKEALNNAKDAAIAYLTSCIKHGDYIPVGIQVQKDIRQSISKKANQHTEDLQIACAIS